jgi:hypothetical protein
LADADADGFALADGDCNDNNPETFPGASKVCDGIDQDCDGVVAEDRHHHQPGGGGGDCLPLTQSTGNSLEGLTLSYAGGRGAGCAVRILRRVLC